LLTPVSMSLLASCFLKNRIYSDKQGTQKLITIVRLRRNHEIVLDNSDVNHDINHPCSF